MSVDWHQPRLFPMPQLGPTSDDYFTPPWLFDRLGLTFDLDVCAPPGGVPWIPAASYYTQADDGLASHWYGRVWMNPPFSGTDPWIARFIEHGDGVCIVPHSRARWHARLWRSSAAFVCPNEPADTSMFLFLRDGEPINIYMPVFLAALGAECIEAIARVGPVRRLAS